MSRLRRFLHIERSRAGAPGGAAEAGPGTARRIGGVESPGPAPQAAAPSGAGLDRFAPPPPPAMELASTGAGERPFTRCVSCGMDHHVSATACTGCGADLGAEAQRTFNEALWAERRAEAAAEAAAQAERRRALEASGGDVSGTRALGEAIAREVGEAERRRLDGELGAGGEVLAAVRRLVDRLLGR